MSIQLVVNNVPYLYPEQGDSFQWGLGATNWAQAVTNNALFKNGGNFFLSSSVDFGSIGGLKAVFFSGRGAVGNTGLLRLANTDSIVWASDIALSMNTASGFLKSNTGFEVPSVILNGANVAISITNAFNQANAAYANGNTTAAQVTLAYNEANTANGLAQSAYTQANTAYANGNTTAVAISIAMGVQNGTFATINSTFSTVNTTFGSVNTAIGVAYANGNATAGQVTLAFNKANLALSTAQNSNLVIQAANSSNLSVVYTGNTVSIDTKITGGGGGGGGNYQVDVSANGSLILANANLNFNNGSGVNVSAIANGTTEANITFTVNTAFTNVLAGLAYANGNTTAVAVATAMGVQNGNFGTINTTFGTVNTTFATLNTTFGTVNTAIGVAYGAANAAANTVEVYANGSLILADANLNFNNGAGVNVSAVANGTTQTNVTFTVNTALTNVLAGLAYANGNATAVAISTAMGVQNTTFGTMNTTFGTVNTAIGTAYGAANAAANTVEVYANGSLILAQANLNFNNGAGVNVSAVANGTTQTNVTFTVNTALTNVLAGLAYAAANLAANGVVANQIAYGTTTQNTLVGTANLIYSPASQSLNVNANVMMTNTSNLMWANAQLQQFYNVTANSIDFVWV